MDDSVSLELISKVIENANATSGALGLMSENLEEVSENINRVEKKIDGMNNNVSKISKNIYDSGILIFFKTMIKWYKKIINAVVLAIMVPVIILIFYVILHLIVKGPSLFPFFKNG